MESPLTMRRPCFVEDDGLASIAVMEPGFSGNNASPSSSAGGGHMMMMRRRNSLRNISSLSSSSLSSSTAVCSPRSGRFYEPRFEEPQIPHFLQACSLCKKPLGGNRDIFMYRGDTPFCSEECRQEQIESDEAKEKNLNYKALRSKKESSKSAASSSSPNKNYPFRTSTVAAA